MLTASHMPYQVTLQFSTKGGGALGPQVVAAHGQALGNPQVVEATVGQALGNPQVVGSIHHHQ